MNLREARLVPNISLLPVSKLAGLYQHPCKTMSIKAVQTGEGVLEAEQANDESQNNRTLNVQVRNSWTLPPTSPKPSNIAPSKKPLSKIEQYHTWPHPWGR